VQKKAKSRREFLKYAGLGTAGVTIGNPLFASTTAQAFKKEPSTIQKYEMILKKPNIILFLCDQLTPFLTGTYGHPVVQTPNLDRLRKKGILFDAAYTPCPIGAPARASMFTGQYVSEIGCYDNAAPLSEEIPTIAHYLTNTGYDTIAAGKTHFIGPDQLHGFRKRLIRNIFPPDFRWTTDYNFRKKLFFDMTLTPFSFYHAQQYIEDGIKVDQWNSNLTFDEETIFRSVEYLNYRGKLNKATVEKDENPDPFFLHVSIHHPHEQFHPPRDLWDLYEVEAIEVNDLPENLEEMYSQMDRWLNFTHGCHLTDKIRDKKSIRVVRRAYYALVTYADRKLGEILDALENNALNDNTVIVFSSDHGDMLCEKAMVQKRCFYEWSARVPMIVAFPDGRGAGTTIHEPVSLIDLLPTFLDLADVRAEHRLKYDGRSLLPLIEGKEKDRIIFSELHCEGVFAPCFMARKGKYKYIYVHGYDDQLFDLEKDPGEWKNLSNNIEYAKIKKELKQAVLKQFNPDKIRADVIQSVKERKLVQQALNRAGIDWSPDIPLEPEIYTFIDRQNDDLFWKNRYKELNSK